MGIDARVREELNAAKSTLTPHPMAVRELDCVKRRELHKAQRENCLSTSISESVPPNKPKKRAAVESIEHLLDANPHLKVSSSF